MDARLLSYYDRELSYLRELGSEFAREYPKVAGQLGLSDGACADPHVERLLEGFAFLAARVQLSIDAEFPRFTEQLLDLIHPQALSPTPSMAVACFAPNPRQSISARGFVLPRGTRLNAEVPDRPGSTCRYRTAHDVTLWPIELTGLAHRACSLPAGGAPGSVLERDAAAVRGQLRLRLRTLDGRPFSELALDRLPFFIPLRDAAGRRLFELCHRATLGVQLRTPAGDRLLSARNAVGTLGFDDEQALLPVTARSFQGYRLLQEYFALPERFSFVELRELRSALQHCHAPEVEVVLLLGQYDPALELALRPSHAQLFCSPVVNLFEHRADRIQLSDRSHEYHVLPDRTRPGDFEVHSVLEVVGHGDAAEPPRPFLPLYAGSARTREPGSVGFFSVQRRPRVSPADRHGAGPPGYAGSETYLSLVDGDAGPYRPSLRQLSIRTVCTNRDLPLALARAAQLPAFQLEVASPVSEVRCVAGPSAPQPSPAWTGSVWRLITHLSCNYLSLVGDGGGNGAPALRELLELHASPASLIAWKQAQSVRSVTSAPVVRRLPLAGPASFGRGLEVRVECEESAFEGASLLGFGMVLEHFFARFASINSFTELVLSGSGGAELARFPARLGRRLGL